MKPWYNISAFEVVQGLNSDIKTGLSRENLEKNRELYGENKIIVSQPKSMFRIIMEEMASSWSIIIVLLVCFYFVNRSKYAIIFLIITFLFIITVFIYYKKKNEKKSLAVEILNSNNVDVLREGNYITVSVNQLVVGDITLLRKNMYVPADIRIIQCENLKVNEMSVTGKNYICEKFSAKISKREVNVEEASNMLFKSSIIVEGEAVGVVVSVGMDTEVGNLIRFQNKNEHSNKGMFKILKKALNRFSIVATLLSVAVFIIGMAMGKNNEFIVSTMEQIWISTLPVVAVVEALLLLMVFLKHCNRKKIYINNISVLEKLSNLQSVFMAKQGVLTEDEYNINLIAVDNMLLKKTVGRNFHVDKYYGNSKVQGDSINSENSYAIKRFLETTLLCNNALYKEETGEYYGDKKEIAFLKFVQETWKDINEKRKKNSRVLDVPVDGEILISTCVNSVDKRFRASSIGPFDNVIGRCTHLLRNDIEVELKGEQLDRVKEMAYHILTSGAEVMAVAYRNFNYKPSLKENIQSNLVLVGLAGCESPVKKDTYNISSFAASRGIDVVVFADENQLSSQWFGKQIGFLQGYNKVYSGVELKFMTEEEQNNVENHEIMFANLSEDQKIKIINEHKKNRGMVAVIASKLTSVPHFTQGDICISYGKDVSGVVKKLSDIYMEDISILSLYNLMSENSKLLNTYKELIYNGYFNAIMITVPIIANFFLKDRLIFNDSWMLFLISVSTIISGFITILKCKKNVTEKRSYDKIQRSPLKGSFILSVTIYLIAIFFQRQFHCKDTVLILQQILIFLLIIINPLFKK
ncbi:ATPase, P-type (transporting), HAD superfamily, subfamily IC [Hathewaya proteolytica DSM 3090]|uniref:ATPase, P-type (Transporting), HAD superfamily, subfamily IC n=1 Tax=Hathewaya proteolytica DSM 3090 TaxID=1121331 RepID=A0A1M6JI63_9CLOT|nr:cation-transporting P-type ATPase [Hathewaya proteolytica]SHJ46374.1 ATPase, P-type (transporting), HAD superfamily, subfamily IC [Hathewaya proteolytica DSM 3090]